MNRDLVIGVGSPHGDDQVGWCVIDYLKERSQLSASLQAVVDPIDLLEHLVGIDHLVIVDACRSGREVGVLTRFDADNGCLPRSPGSSTHRISLAETLELARALQRLPTRVVVFGVEVDQCHPQHPMHPRLEQAVPGIAQRIRDELIMKP